MRSLGRKTASAFVALAAFVFVGAAARAQAPVVLLAAGDIASCASSGDEATAQLLDQNAGVVATLGDHVYPRGTPAEFAQCYEPSWGRHRARTRPAPGNHEYLTPGAAGYFGYFGAAAGDPSAGHYSYDLGAWHVVVLNSNCWAVAGGCGAGSPQEGWLRADLAAHPSRCTLAYWHHPRFSSRSSVGSMESFWKALYENGADVVLAGHDHSYERLAPQTPIGDPSPAYGIREFIVGTGGINHTGIVARLPTSEVVNTDTFGILKLTLRSGGYDWVFIPEAGKTFTDVGSGSCHDAPPDVTPPTVSLGAPPPGTVIRGQVTFSAEAADDTALARVDFLVGGTVVARDTAAPYTLTWDSMSFPDGARPVTARAVDTSGNATTSVEHPVVVDNTVPETTIVRGPPPRASSTAPTFYFSSEPGSAFECSLDGRAFARCASPQRYARLRAGTHVFRVRAWDAVGKVDPTPARWAWTIDLTRPDTAITFGQMSRAAPGTATFRFTSTERAATFLCSLDQAPWASCASPATYQGLAPGFHSFRVRSTDAARNTDWSSAERKWYVSRSGTGVVLTGSERRDVFSGTPGNDLIYGFGGNDVIRGRGGKDRLYGGSGNDRIGGGLGNDLLVGEPGRDVLSGGAGLDVLRARDGGRDFVDGGLGRDRARVDRLLDRLRAIEARF